MSSFYVVVLVLNSMFRTRYINFYWLKKWRAPALVKVKKFWERYRKTNIPTPTTTPFSYEKQNQGETTKPLNTYDRIKTSLKTVARPTNKDEYKNYNSHKSYDPGIKRALVWWY